MRRPPGRCRLGLASVLGRACRFWNSSQRPLCAPANGREIPSYLSRLVAPQEPRRASEPQSLGPQNFRGSLPLTPCSQPFSPLGSFLLHWAQFLLFYPFSPSLPLSPSPPPPILGLLSHSVSTPPYLSHSYFFTLSSFPPSSLIMPAPPFSTLKLSCIFVSGPCRCLICAPEG